MHTLKQFRGKEDKIQVCLSSEVFFSYDLSFMVSLPHFKAHTKQKHALQKYDELAEGYKSASFSETVKRI